MYNTISWKKASYDGSTMIARNDDSPSGRFTAKKFVVIHPEEQPRVYKSVLSHIRVQRQCHLDICSIFVRFTMNKPVLSYIKIR